MSIDGLPTATNDDNSTEARLRRIVCEVLAPLVVADGGRIEFVGLRGDIAEVSLSGACRGCPGQPMTLRGVVLPALQAVAPEIRDVRAVAPPRTPSPSRG